MLIRTILLEASGVSGRVVNDLEAPHPVLVDHLCEMGDKVLENEVFAIVPPKPNRAARLSGAYPVQRHIGVGFIGFSSNVWVYWL